MKKVEVIWNDIISWSGWKSEQVAVDFTDYDDMAHKSIGYLVKQNKMAVVLCQSYSLDNDIGKMGELLKIPKKAIISIKELRSGGDLK